jgi:hypothetical protein
MVIKTVHITTRELQQALRDYCAANGGIPLRATKNRSWWIFGPAA